MIETTKRLTMLAGNLSDLLTTALVQLDTDMEVLRDAYVTDVAEIEQRNPFDDELSAIDRQAEKAFSGLQAAMERLVEARSHIDRLRSTCPLICELPEIRR